MNIKYKKIIFHILDFIFLISSYMLCDYLTIKINLPISILISLTIYTIISIILHKIFKIEI